MRHDPSMEFQRRWGWSEWGQRELRKGALTEMAMDIAQPIKDFVSRNEKYFTSIRYKKSSRSFLTQENITSIISAYLYDYVRQAIMSPNSTYNDLLSQALLSRTEKELKSKYVDLDSVRTKIQAIINKGLFFEFNEAVKKMAWIVAGYHDKMMKEGAI